METGAGAGRQAGAALLDTYQAEREPQVRAITEAAIFMGRVVCTQDAAEAAKRDAAMLAPKEGQAGPPPLGVPPMSGGLFDASPLSGQQAAQTARGDDVWGEGFVCVARGHALADARSVSWPVPCSCAMRRATKPACGCGRRWRARAPRLC